jgi:hypothetical protein
MGDTFKRRFYEKPFGSVTDESEAREPESIQEDWEAGRKVCC